MKTLQKLINQQWEETMMINKKAFTMCRLLSCLSLILMSWSQSFRTWHCHCKLSLIAVSIIDKVMTTAVHSASLKSYQLYLSQSYSSQSYSLSANYEHSVTSIQTNQQETWDRTSEQKSDCNVCHFALNEAIIKEYVHIFCWLRQKRYIWTRDCIAWGSQSRDSTLMSLDFLMQQLILCGCYWRKKRKTNKTQADHHEAT
jgi:hypothetical protein